MSAWIASTSLDELDAWTNWSSIVVVAAILLEEASRLLRFTAYLKERFVEKRSRTGILAFLRQQEKLLESLGLVLLVVSLGAENRFQHAAYSKESAARQSADREIEGLRASNIALRQEVDPRDVASPSKAVLDAIAAAPSAGIIVRSYPTDLEAARLADEITNVISKMRPNVWPAKQVMGEMPELPLLYGVFVTGADAPLVSALRAWLDASNLKAAPGQMPPPIDSLANGEFPDRYPGAYIFVAAKPLPAGTQ